MKIRLSYKIFGAFLLTTLAIVCLSIATLSFFGHRNFIDFVNRMETSRLTELSQMLTSEYQATGSWRRLRTNPEIWRGMVRKTAPDRLGQGAGPPPPPPRDFSRQPDRMSFDGRSAAPPPGPDLFEGPSRIFLLDAEKHLVAGRRESPEDLVLRELSSDSKPIGWLGISKIEPRLTPPEAVFLERQKQLFYVMGACTFLLTAIVSFFLLRVLMSHPNRVYSRNELLNQVQGYDFEGYDRTIDTHVKNLRKKIAEKLPERDIIATVYGVGYKFLSKSN